MTEEYWNTRTVSRKKFVVKIAGSFSLIILLLFLRYYLAPEDVQNGLGHSSRMLSWNEFLVYSSLITLIGILFMFWSRMILRIRISEEENKLTIDLIDRFRWKVKTLDVLLSETQIQIDHKEKTNYWLMKSTPEYFLLYLNNPDFGTLTVSQQDFDNIAEIVQKFDKLKQTSAGRMRAKRTSRNR